MKLQTQRVEILAKNMDGPRQAQTFSELSSDINSSARRASVKAEVSMMTKIDGVDKARFQSWSSASAHRPGKLRTPYG